VVGLYSFSKPVATIVNITVDTPANVPANTPDLYKGKTKTKTSVSPLQGGNAGDENL
jgi:hypothetical protein